MKEVVCAVFLSFCLISDVQAALLIRPARLRALDRTAFIPVNQREWNYNMYDTRRGPYGWQHIPGNGDCGGGRQSPINIRTKNVVFNFRNSISYRYPRGPIRGQLENKGKGPHFHLPDWDTRYRIWNVPYRPGQTYILTDIHVHFSDHSRTGSEHTVDGERYDGELHLVHYNSKYAANITVANTMPDGLVVIAVFLKERRTFEGPFTRFTVNQLSRIQEAGAEVPDLFPDLRYISLDRAFYSYQGSLTTPGCHQSVAWIIKRNPIFISPTAMTILRRTETYADERFSKQGNVRPTQPCNGRLVEANFIETK